jgi:restriction endonuclease
MKLQFDPNQPFQLDAISAVTDLFEGPPQGAPEFAVISMGAWGGLFAGQGRSELGVGNHFLLAEDRLAANTRAVQMRNDIDVGAQHAAPLLPEAYRDLTSAVIDLLSAYQIERHIRKDRDEGVNRLKQEVTLSPEFQVLWERIKPKTTYRVEFETEILVQRAVDALKRMERIGMPYIRVSAGPLGVRKGGVTATAMSVAEEQVEYENHPVPDLLAYLQNETELTRSTLVRILKASGRLSEFFNNPQRFMDAVAALLKHELHRLLVDGVKYERIDGSGLEAEWEMLLFKNEALINYLTALQVNKSVYEYVVYDSEVEREFASVSTSGRASSFS